MRRAGLPQQIRSTRANAASLFAHVHQPRSTAGPTPAPEISHSMNPDHFIGGLLIGIGLMLAIGYIVSVFCDDEDDEL
jgi:hypothetical protein